MPFNLPPFRAFLVLLVPALAIVRAADTGAKSPPPTTPAARADLSDAEQERAARTLAAQRPEMVKFVTAFPKASFMIDHRWRPDRVRLWLIAGVSAGHVLTLDFDGQFNADFTEVTDARWLSFTLAVARDRKIEQVLKLGPEHLDDVCSDLEAFITRQRQLQKKS